jgi:hypothetical protein
MNKLLLATTAAVLVTGAAAVTGCGSDTNSSSAPPKRDWLGEPFITDAQGKAIRKGMSARAAFRKLGGKPDISATSDAAGPILGYDFPIRGTGYAGDQDRPGDATYWQICIGHGRVLSKRRGDLDHLPALCPENFPIVNPTRNLRCLYDSSDGGTISCAAMNRKAEASLASNGTRGQVTPRPVLMAAYWPITYPNPSLGPTILRYGQTWRANNGILSCTSTRRGMLCRTTYLAGGRAVVHGFRINRWRTRTW